MSLSALFVIACLVAGTVSAYVLLSPRRTWDSPPTVIVDNRGQGPRFSFQAPAVPLPCSPRSRSYGS